MLVEESTSVIKSIQHRIYLHRALVVRRIAVLLLLLYFSVLVDAGSGVFLDTVNGVFSASIGTTLFPIPFAGLRMLTAYVPLSQNDVLIYIIFVNQGIWNLWMLSGIIYIMMPLAIWGYRTIERPILKSKLEPHEKEEKVGIVTSTIAIFSIALSVATFSFHFNFMNYGPVPLVVVLGLSTVIVVALLYEILKRLQK